MEHRAPTMADGWTPRTSDGGIRWSWHVLANYLRCPKLFELSVVRDLVPLMYRRALSLGSAVHKGLEVVFLRLQAEQVKAGRAFWRPSDNGLDTLATLAARAAEEHPGLAGDDRMEAVRLVRAYVVGDMDGRGGPRDFAEWRVLSVEQTVAADLAKLFPKKRGRRAIPWTQTPDLVVEVGGAAEPYWRGLWVVDHKTSAALRGDSFSGYRRDGQALALVATLRAAGVPVRGFIPSIIVKTQVVRCIRDYVEFTAEEVEAFVAQLALWQRAAARAVRADARGAGSWPENWTACMGRYGPCDFYDWCRDGEETASAMFGSRDAVLQSDVATGGGGPAAYTVEEG